MMARHTAARSAMAIMLGSLTAGALPAHADVVYDTLWLTNQMLIDAAVGNDRGGGLPVAGHDGLPARR